MDYEKKYKEALERARDYYKANLKLDKTDENLILEDILPELKESKDEKIRKAIYGWINTRPSLFFDDGFSKEQMLAWLEKQGKQIPADKVEPKDYSSIDPHFGKPIDKQKPKFHEGDWVVIKANGHVKQIVRIEYFASGHPQYIFSDGLWFGNGTEARLWTIQDAKDGDVLASKDGDNILIFRNLDTSTSFSSYYNIAGKGELGWSNECFIPATKEQRDRLFQKMEEAGYMWDAEKKKPKKIEQKSTDKDEPKEDNRPVTERIKMFDDACNALGDEHPLVTQYRLTAAAYKGDPMTEDFIAYLKLRIIVAALNEGWEPKFEKGEYRYYPWFYLYTKEQYDELDDEEKGRCVLRSGSYTFSSIGFVCANAYSDASNSNTSYGSRLVFRTRELAAYAGRQFTEEWADFVFKTE